MLIFLQGIKSLLKMVTKKKLVIVGEKFDVCFVAVSDGRLVGVPRM